MKKRAVLPSIYCFSISFNSIIDLSDRKESDRVCFKCTNIIKVSMKKCIIFDMDGTLWDSSASVLAAGNEVIENPGLAADPITLGDDEYFVLGDNRNNSQDSRAANVGLIHRDELLGRAWVRIWPFSEFGVIRHE